MGFNSAFKGLTAMATAQSLLSMCFSIRNSVLFYAT